MFHDMSELLFTLMAEPPQAIAKIKGSNAHPALKGQVRFYPFDSGTLMAVHITGLPFDEKDVEKSFFGFHIHEGNVCGGNAQDPFADAGSHWNPDHRQHPHHKGDLPPLPGNHGDALMVFYTDSFTPEETIGHTVIVHSMPDEFTSQPSGNSGEKIGCGVIKEV